MNKDINLPQFREQFTKTTTTDIDCLRAIAIEAITSSSFYQADVDQKTQTLITIAWKLAFLRSSSFRSIAILAINQFSDILDNDKIKFHHSMELYNALYTFLWTSADDITSLEPFSSLSIKFQKWLKKQLKTSSSEFDRNLKFSKNLNIAYLLHSAEYTPTNAITPLIISLAEKHEDMADRKIFVYLIHHGSNNFIEKISSKNFIVRPFFQPKYDRLDEIAEKMKEDKIDIIITDQNRSVATALFTQRVASVQIFLDVGFPYWNIENIDWTLSPTLIEGNPDKRSTLTCAQSLESLKINANIQESEKIRAPYPNKAFILGIFTRLIKITASFLNLMERILGEDSRFFLIIVGGGSPDPIHDFLSQSKHKERITFLNQNVDLAIYGKAIDVMCDTFPFVGGVACREIGAQGTPVVSMLGTPWDPLLQAERSQDLLAQTEEEYVQILKRLLNDVDFFKRQCQVAHELVSLHTDVSNTVKQVESAIQAAITQRSNTRVNKENF